jgi:4-azaleucine resistance transporter AzlC
MNTGDEKEEHMQRQLSFTWAGALAGARQAGVLALSVFIYGTLFGVLARQAGLSLAEALLMSGMVSAGTSQFMALGLWTTPLPMLTIVLTTLVVNLRHLLMGAALRPWFAGLPISKAYSSVFFMGDESWALTVREFDRGGRDAAFLLGSGLLLFVSWLGATCCGWLVGAALGDPARWGLDFAFTAAFAALLVGMWKGRADLLPWAVAAVVAIAAAQWLPGKWYIILGGLVGSVVGAMRHAD